MDENLIPNFDDDKVAKVRGNLFNRLIQAILNNRWTTGWGLISEKGANGGLISLDPNVIPGPSPDRIWRGKVTKNTELVDGTSAPSEKHQIREVDANDDVLPSTGPRRETDIARAVNRRKGVPIGTICLVFEFDGGDPDAETGSESPGSETTHYRFTPWDGLDESPQDMTTDPSEPGYVMTDDAYTTDWDVEDQDGENGVNFNTARVFIDADTFSVFGRTVTYDASGMLILVDDEVRGGLVGDPGVVSLDGHITLRGYAGGPDDKLKVAINEPQADFRTLIFKSTDATVTFNNGESTAEVEFDDSGRALLANGEQDLEIDFSAPGAGGNDGQGYEFVDYNGVNVGAEPDSGRIDFKDSAASPAAGSQEVNWTITNDAANDTVDVEGEVDIDAWLKALGTYDDEKKQVLVNDNGTIKWVDTAECP